MADQPITERVTALQHLLEARYPAFQWSVKYDPAPITLGILDPCRGYFAYPFVFFETDVGSSHDRAISAFFVPSGAMAHR